MRRSIAVVIAVAVLGSIVPGSLARAQSNDPGQPGPMASRYEPGEVIVRFHDDAEPAARRRARVSAGATGFRAGPFSGSQVLRVGGSVPRAVRALEALPAVRYAEPNYLMHSSLTPNDPAYPNQWALRSGVGSIGAPSAWDITTGANAPVIAVVDSGMQMDHPDLAPNLWVNPGEIPGDGIDNDGNGYRDDIHGWDWVGSDAIPSDENGHGTHVAGISGARGNDGYGVAGVAWGPKLMVLRTLDASGKGSTSNIASAFSYAAAKGVKVVNASLGGSHPSQTLTEAITRSPGTLFVTAAGNDGNDNSLIGSYPCNVVSMNLLCVAASDQRDQLASFSNYGLTTVHLAAPGSSILSATRQSRHGYMSGTSMATPMVAGAAALLWSYKPSATVSEVKNSILAGVDKIPSMQLKLISGGRLNIAKALAQLGAAAPPADDEAEPGEDEQRAGTTEPQTMTLKLIKKTRRYKARGNVKPVQEAGDVRLILLRKRSGSFQRVARKDVSLTLRPDGRRNLYEGFFGKRKSGRCRVKAKLFVGGGPAKLVRTTTFGC